MTDIMKLADNYARLNAQTTAPGAGDARAALQSAIEALQAENERLKRELEISKLDAKEWYSQADALQAKLDYMGKGEPVAWIFPNDLQNMLEMETFKQVYSVKVGSPEGESVPLYAAPKALAPLTPLTQQQRMAVWNDVKSEGYGRWEFSFADVVDAVEKAHGIGGTP